MAIVSWPAPLTRKRDTSEPFPPLLPRAHKITPKSVPTLHEGSGKRDSKYSTALYLPKYLILNLYFSGLACCKVWGGLLALLCACSFLLVSYLLALFPWSRLTGHLLNVWSRPWLLCAINLECKSFRSCSTISSQNWSPADSFWRAPFGGCGLLAMTKYSPNLWGLPCQVSAACCVSRRGFSPPESCM